MSARVPERPSLVRPSLFSVTWWLAVLGGWGVVAWALLGTSWSSLSSMGAPLAMMAALVVLGELRPVVTSWTGSIPVPFSTAFVFASMYMWGLGPASLLMALGVVTSELAERKATWKLLFNVGQYVVSLSAAWGVMLVAGVHPSPAEPLTTLGGGDLGWLVGGWIAYHLVNLALVAGLAESDGQSVAESFTEDFWFYSFSTMAVLAVSPLIAIVAGEASASWLLIPLLVLPLVGVYATARVSRQREQASLHDTLTGLPNRALLALRAGEALVDSRRSGRPLALCLLDLDHFKEVNDTLGHHVGDELLSVVADRLNATVRPTDTVARLGGDEFAVLLPGVGGEHGAVEVAERISTALAEPIRLAGVMVDVTVSVGIALAGLRSTQGEHTPDFETLLRHADVAMYLAKEGRTGVAIYDAARDPHSPQRLGAVAELRRTLENDELLVHYQPKVSLADGHVVGVEALARWMHPTLGAVPPEDFVSMAERTGLIHLLTRRVLDRALAQAALWWDEGMDLPVAVNVSMHDLQERDMVDLVTESLHRHSLPPQALVLEITESVFVTDASRAVVVLRRLRDLGVRSSLDDFGTGFSTLVRIQRLPVAEVKIDQSFVAALDSGGDDGVVRAVIGLAHGLGLGVVAEGVETDEVRQRLAALGCDAGQGWALARAMPPDEAMDWLRAHRQRPPDSAGARLRVVGDDEAGGG